MSDFKGRGFPTELILICVRQYLAWMYPDIAK